MILLDGLRGWRWILRISRGERIGRGASRTMTYGGFAQALCASLFDEIAGDNVEAKI